MSTAKKKTISGKKRKLDETAEEWTPSLKKTRTTIRSGSKTTQPATPHPQTRHILSAKAVEPLRASLLKWYEIEHAKRGMPWRRAFHDPLPTDPDERAHIAYKVWISEIMCQQTQVATVIPYYNRWMEKFPNIRALAASDIESVNSLWKGLGYYSRAARLLSAAQKVVKDYYGRLPESPSELEKQIPGIGRYSSGAIASIAYGVRAPVLDGNVHRLLARLLGVHASSKSKTTLDALWAGAASFVDDEQCQFPGDVNQALIELGSVVCRPRDPSCEGCPLKEGCVAYRETKDALEPEIQDIEDLCSLCEPHVHPPSFGVTRYPMKVEKKKAREESDLVLAIEWRDSKKRPWYLLEKRPDEGLLAGLWNFPNSCDIDPGSDKKQLDAMVPAILNEVLEEKLDIDIASAKTAPKFKRTASSTDPDILTAKLLRHTKPVQHTFSHIKKTYLPIYLVLEGGDAPPVLPNCTKPVIPGKGTIRKKKKRKTDSEDSEDEVIEKAVGVLKWVPEEKLEEHIVGTCISKIWTSVKEKRDAGAWLHKTK